MIRQRYSCRTYLKRPLSKTDLASLEHFATNWKEGPLGNPVRCHLTAKTKADGSSLKGLGTYGFIKNPAAFIVGAVRDKPGALEDFGYIFEQLILKATDLEIGSCWLGGTFTKSRFARLIDLEKDEIIPSVISLGYPANHRAFLDRVSRIYAGAEHRLPWEDLFFQDSWDIHLSPEEAGIFQEALKLVRLAPSASNKQPWRILKSGQHWHFFIARTPNYPPPVFDFLLGLADLQRIDIGIAMAHFELGLQEVGLQGSWLINDPYLIDPNQKLEYTATWQPD